MKQLKIIVLVLALVAVAALMALAGTASAKVCSASGTGTACAGTHGKVYTGPIHANLTTAKKAVLTSGFITVSCTESTAAGSVTSGGTSPAKGILTALTFSGCTDGSGNPCTASTSASVANPWPVTITTTTPPDGLMTVTNVTGSFTCTIFGSPVKCNYTASDAGGAGEIVVKGGAPAEIIATKVALTKEEGSNALCSSTASWSGEYAIDEPINLFLT